MKKFGKFVVTALSVAACVGGAYYFVKNILKKNNVDDFDDFDDDFDDMDSHEDTTSKTDTEDRGYVTLNFSEEASEEAKSSHTPSKSEPVSDSAPVVKPEPVPKPEPAL
ncbi:MAG: hypothetical protein RSA52_05015 [Acetivibrio sp.]